MMMAQDFKASAVLAGMHAREKPEPAVENAKAKSSEGCGLSANAVILIGKNTGFGKNRALRQRILQ
jgi:hypothetical protein